ncbi:MAG: tRNA 2-thiouridine(34) synthase MnmA [Actinobacteria bacterium]|nr:tRNA 2-thiouridine(34) synthase MnmA [Actinomycetota bacterium]
MDSAFAALKLIEEGRTLETATVRLWPGGDRRSCCSPGALQRARQTAEWLGLPHHFVDREAEFKADVVEPFVAAYLGGETPNPCVRCNPRRLAALVGVADGLGLARVATGHYARLVWRDGEPFVARGADPAKDQSYMLWAVAPEVLARLEFPLGETTKRETRAAAEAAGLPVAAEPESQEVCFAVDGYQRFLELSGVRPQAGAIVARDGAALGTHRGQWRYTIGQRRGLGVSSTQPLFVLARRAAANEVVVGRRDELDVREVTVRDLVDRGLGDGAGLHVQLRYRSPAVPVTGLERLGAERVLVRLGEVFAGAAPGQSAVFYRDDVVVGGGVLADPA